MSRPILIAAGFLCLMPVQAFGEPQVSISETEPNNTTATANASGLVDSGSVFVIGATIGNGPLVGADRDFFSIEVTPEAAFPLLLTIAMDAGDDAFDGYTRLFDASAAELLNWDDASDQDSNPLGQTYIVEPGTYYVGVSNAMNPAYAPADAETGRSADTGDYQLAIILSPALPPSESLESPEPVVIDSVPALITGQFIGDGPDGRRDTDTYTVNIAAPLILIAEVRPSHLGLLDPILSGIHMKGTNTPASSKTVRLEQAVPGGVPVSVVVGDADPYAEQDFTSTGYYDLFIDAIPVISGGGPFEPNDSLLEATPIPTPGTVSFGATIGDGVFGGFRGDVDFYDVKVRFDERLEVEVSPSGTGDVLSPVIQVYAFSGHRIATGLADDSGVARVSFRGNCDRDGYPQPFDRQTFTVGVMGAADRVTMDPFIPQHEYCNFPPDACLPPVAFYATDGGPGSTGDYTVTLTAISEPACGNEADDTIGDVTESVLIGEGAYSCSAGMIRDGPCSTNPADGVDLLRVTVTTPPVTLDVRLSTFDCSEGRMIRVFDATGSELASDDDADSPVERQPHIRLPLTVAGDYYIGVSDDINTQYDPLIACSGHGDFESAEQPDRYAVDIALTRPTVPNATPPDPSPDLPDDRLFATSLDFFSDTIVELDPATGVTINAFCAPEAPLGGGEGLAYDGSDLFMLGNGARYPMLYRLNPETGEVRGERLTWFGSGRYGGIVALGETLHIVDILEDAIYTLPATLEGPVTRTDVAVSLFGPLATTAGQSRLLATDADDASLVHHLDPTNGAVIQTVSLGTRCVCDADFDGDGDVDAADAALFDACELAAGSAGPTPCHKADLDCDGLIGDADRTILECQSNGPNVPPSDGCCAADLPFVPVHATALATTGPDFLLAGDWTKPIVQRFNRAGTPLDSVAIDAPVGSLAGRSFAGADGDGDFDVDLQDFGRFQACFGEGSPLIASCTPFDLDRDDDVDLNDFDVFQDTFTGVVK